MVKGLWEFLIIYNLESLRNFVYEKYNTSGISYVYLFNINNKKININIQFILIKTVNIIFNNFASCFPSFKYEMLFYICTFIIYLFE